VLETIDDRRKTEATMKMMKIMIAAAAVALLASPVVAQDKKEAPRLFTGQGITQGNAVYDCTGKYLGADPDAGIRAQLLKEGGRCGD
jgi:hypothetical protein